MKKILELTLKNFILIIVSIMLTGCLSSEDSSEDILADRGGNGLKPVADTYVSSSAANKNFGGQRNLIVKEDSSETMEALIKFDVPDISSPIESAELQLYVRNATVGTVKIFKKLLILALFPL